MKGNEKPSTPSVLRLCWRQEACYLLHSFLHFITYSSFSLRIYPSTHLSTHPPFHSSIHPLILEIFIMWNMCQPGFSSKSNEVGPHWRSLSHGIFFCFSGGSQDSLLGWRKKISEFLFICISYPLKIFQFGCPWGCKELDMTEQLYTFYNEHNVLIPYYVYIKQHAQKLQ